jgi:hypothetical protein
MGERRSFVYHDPIEGIYKVSLYENNQLIMEKTFTDYKPAYEQHKSWVEGQGPEYLAG